MSDELVWKWVIAFKDAAWMFMMLNEMGNDQSLLKILCRKLTKKVTDYRGFMISLLSNEFPEVSRSVLYEMWSDAYIIKSFVHIGYRKYWLRCTKSNVSQCVEFLELYNIDGFKPNYHRWWNMGDICDTRIEATIYGMANIYPFKNIYSMKSC